MNQWALNIFRKMRKVGLPLSVFLVFFVSVGIFFASPRVLFAQSSPDKTAQVSSFSELVSLVASEAKVALLNGANTESSTENIGSSGDEGEKQLISVIPVNMEIKKTGLLAAVTEGGE